METMHKSGKQYKEEQSQQTNIKRTKVYENNRKQATKPNR